MTEVPEKVLDVLADMARALQDLNVKGDALIPLQHRLVVARAHAEGATIASARRSSIVTPVYPGQPPARSEVPAKPVPPAWPEGLFDELALEFPWIAQQWTALQAAVLKYGPPARSFLISHIVGHVLDEVAKRIGLPIGR